jgi:hypothetical protein
VPSTRTCEWLPQTAHFNISVLTHKNPNELAGVLPVALNVMADVIGFCGKLLVLSVECYGRCNTAFSCVTFGSCVFRGRGHCAMPPSVSVNNT